MPLLLDDPLAQLCNARAWIDVRAPCETGTMPHATRLPILTDEERHQVGLCYKKQGQAAAIALGHELVAGATKAARIQAWVDHLKVHPSAAIYCWRGGLRSQTAQTWLQEAGYVVPRVEGGYKALRQACLEALDRAHLKPMLILSGRTGSGKTDFLLEVEQGIDLEAAARHRGSAFGHMPEPQPEPVEFEAHLAVQLTQKQDQPFWLLEDEGRMIGRLAVPKGVRQPMLEAPVVVMQVSMQDRIEQIARDYVYAPKAAGESAQATLERLCACLDRVQKRLGLERHARIEQELKAAFSTDEGDHGRWISSLLRDYYDPMYDYALSQKADRIVFEGDREAVREFVRGYRP